jgi:hypothetical protein
MRRVDRRGPSASSEGAEQHDLVAQAGAGGEQRGERAGGGALIGAAEGGDDVLTVGTVLAAVRDDLQVGAGPGGLEAEEHGAPGGAQRVAAMRHNKVHAR